MTSTGRSSLTRELIRAKSGPGGDDPFNLAQLSGLLLYRGDWREAQRMAEAAMDGYALEGGELHSAWGLRGVALVAAHQGRLVEARRLAADGLALALERGDPVVATFHRQILGFVAVSAGEWAEADIHLTEAAALAARVAVRHPGRFKFAGDQVEAALALGHVERAAAVHASLAEAARIAPTPWVVAIEARSAALLAAARGDLAGAAVTFDRALLAHTLLAMPFERARNAAGQGPAASASEGEATRRRDAPRRARGLRGSRRDRLGRSRATGARPRRAPAPRPRRS